MPAAAQLGLSLGPGRASWQRQPLPRTPRGAERGFPAVTADLACSRQAAEGLSGRERPGRGDVGAGGRSRTQPRASSGRLGPFGTI